MNGRREYRGLVRLLMKLGLKSAADYNVLFILRSTDFKFSAQQRLDLPDMRIATANRSGQVPD